MTLGKISMLYGKQLPGLNSDASYNTNRTRTQGDFKFILGFIQPNKMIPNEDANASLLPMCSIDFSEVETYIGDVDHTYLTMCEFLSWNVAQLAWSGLLGKLCQHIEVASLGTSSRLFERARARIFVDVSDQIARNPESLSTFPLPLTTRIASTVNNDLNALAVSHCSFFVNVTHFINKSKPQTFGFQKLECFC